MELKKNPEANIEQKKTLLFMVGLVVALSSFCIIVQWKDYDMVQAMFGDFDYDQEEEEMIPITQQEIVPPPPPPPAAVEIEIVEDDEEVEDIEIEETEIDEDTEVEIVEIVEEVEAEQEIFTVVEDMPGFPGGEEELFRYLGKNIKYPAMAKDAGIKGMVYVNFVVWIDGTIKDVKVLRGIGGGCDEEALRVVENMPKWKPGKQRGKTVPVSYNLPIRFTLK
jgi:periplasmic protein TonB